MPPTRSTGTPASSNAFSTPMCEQPLQGRGTLVTRWESLRLHPQERPWPLWDLTPWHGSRPVPATPPHLAPPPPSTRAMVLPVSTRARREKSLCRSARLENTFSYSSFWGENRGDRKEGVQRAHRDAAGQQVPQPRPPWPHPR